ncbi:hypothetical protein GMRT_10078 [Giardia muris]|uniref:Uncharacterized protein n=1 Tax=Giardia muris TaxID=5742 RepID=A0A4Z1T1Y1_GIAMU|nr:hypothetical protein GMRT_10078 [Giardia muris]|eukprot:TNJ27953.1 hypothetical protein GMRT_10078 [Giardia muris]
MDIVNVLGLSSLASDAPGVTQSQRALLERLHQLSLLLRMVEQARLVGSYAEYPSRYILPLPFTPTLLAFTDCIEQELVALRVEILERAGSSPTAPSRALAMVERNDLRLFPEVLERLGWFVAEPLVSPNSASARLLDELHSLYQNHEQSETVARVVRACRVAFSISLLEDMSFKRGLNGEVLSITTFDIQVVDHSLPAFFTNLYAPLKAYAFLVNLVLRTVIISTHGAPTDEDDAKEGRTTRLLLSEQEKGTVLYATLLEDIAHFQRSVVPILFLSDPWAIHDTEIIRDFIVDVNYQLSNTLLEQKQRLCAWVSQLFVHNVEAVFYHEAAVGLFGHLCETISYSSLDKVGIVTIPTSFLLKLHSIVQGVDSGFFANHLKKVISPESIAQVQAGLEKDTATQPSSVPITLANSLPYIEVGLIYARADEQHAAQIGLAHFFLEASAESLIETISIFCRLTAFAQVSLHWALTELRQIEKRLTFVYHSGQGIIDANGKKLMVIGIGEHTRQRDFATLRRERTTGTLVAPVFVSVTRTLYLMMSFVSSYNTYIHDHALLDFGKAEAVDCDLRSVFADALASLEVTHEIGMVIQGLMRTSILTALWVAVLSKLSVSFTSNEQLLAVPHREIRELELEFRAGWTEVLERCDRLEQEQGLQTAALALSVWLPSPPPSN